MNMIIKNKAIVADDWTVLRLQEQEKPENVNVAPGLYFIKATLSSGETVIKEIIKN